MLDHHLELGFVRTVTAVLLHIPVVPIVVLVALRLLRGKKLERPLVLMRRLRISSREGTPILSSVAPACAAGVWDFSLPSNDSFELRGESLYNPAVILIPASLDSGTSRISSLMLDDILFCSPS